MSNYPEIYLLRHGQTEWNLEGRMQGRLDSPLTELGQQQAITQGNILYSLGLEGAEITCLASPQGRAAHTAKLALQKINRTATSDDRLRETDMGQWQNRLSSDIRKECSAELWQDLGPSWYFFNAPDGESFADHRARCKALLEDLKCATVLVTHGITSKVLRGLWLGLEYRDTVLLPGGQGCVYHMKQGAQHLCNAEFPNGMPC